MKQQISSKVPTFLRAVCVIACKSQQLWTFQARVVLKAAMANDKLQIPKQGHGKTMEEKVPNVSTEKLRGIYEPSITRYKYAETMKMHI